MSEPGSELRGVVESQNKRIRELEAENARRRKAAKDAKDELVTAKAELVKAASSLAPDGESWQSKYEAASESLDTFTTAFDTFEQHFGEGSLDTILEAPETFAKALGGKPLHEALKALPEIQAKANATPEEWEAKYNELSGQLRDRKHRDAFNKAAIDAKINPDALDDAFELSKYKAESDDVDDAALSELVTNLAKTKPFLLTPATNPAEATSVAKSAPAKLPQAAPGAGRGNYCFFPTEAHPPATCRGYALSFIFVLVHENETHQAPELMMKQVFRSSSLVFGLTALMMASRASAGVITTNIYATANDTGSGVTLSGSPAQTLSTNDIQFLTNNGNNWFPLGGGIAFGADVTGALAVASTGTYAFALTSDDGSYLFIDGNLKINDGADHSPNRVSTNVSLTAGIHSFEVQFHENGIGTSGVNLDLDPNGGVTFTATSAVPEPSTFIAGAIGALAGLARKRARTA